MAVACALTCLAATVDLRAATFTNVTAGAGIDYAPFAAGHAMTGGAVAGDVNGDGWVDLFITRHNDTDKLYQNNGDGTFADVSTSAGFTNTTKSNGAVLGDIDNDGDLDLYVTTVGYSRNYLYINNGQGQFVDEATTRGAEANINGLTTFKFGATMGDYDNDGFLDIYTTQWGADLDPLPGESVARLYRNQGDGTFVDSTLAAGVWLEDAPYLGNPPALEGVYAFSPRFADLDGDGYQDLAISGDFGNSRLFWNNGDGTFTDGTYTAGVATDENGMGTAIADYDGDGRLDWFVTSIYDADQTCETELCSWGYSGNRLYRNNGDRTFTDATDAAGVRDGGWGWGTTFFDYDNDGDQDLIMTNGIDFNTSPEEKFKTDRSVLWQNDGTGVFTDVSLVEGVTDTGSGKGLITLDYDQDGDRDVLIINNEGSPVLYRNDSNSGNHWLDINLIGTISNLDGLGAVITVTPDLNDPAEAMIHEVNVGSNYLGHDESTAHFGLGAGVSIVDLVTIAWPASGIVQSFTEVSANQSLMIYENYAGDFDEDLDVDQQDLQLWQAGYGTSSAGIADGDADQDGDVDGADLLAWQRNHGMNLALHAASQAVPEPTSLVLVSLLLVTAGGVSGAGRSAWLRQTGIRPPSDDRKTHTRAR